MKYVDINNSKVSVIGIGTHLIGGKENADYSKDDLYIELIKEAVKLGVNHIDTSEIYANGHTEEIIGQAINGFDRKDLFIASKVWKDNLKHDDLINSLSLSLKRLNTDYLDLYYIHWPNPSIDLKETIITLEQLKDSGKIKNIGLSNFSFSQIKEASSFLKSSKIDAIQLEHNLINRCSNDILSFCRNNKITFVAYKPLCKGAILKSGNNILESLSYKYKKSKAQIALNWLINQDNIITIPKISRIEHLKDNIDSINFKLENDDYNKLNETDFTNN